MYIMVVTIMMMYNDDWYYNHDGDEVYITEVHWASADGQTWSETFFQSCYVAMHDGVSSPILGKFWKLFESLCEHMLLMHVFVCTLYTSILSKLSGLESLKFYLNTFTSINANMIFVPTFTPANVQKKITKICRDVQTKNIKCVAILLKELEWFSNLHLYILTL